MHRQDAAHRQPTHLHHRADLDVLASGEPPFETRLVAADTLSALLALLDPGSASIAILRQEGCKLADIAARLGVAKRTIRRRLKAIRTIWESSGGLSRPEPIGRGDAHVQKGG